MDTASSSANHSKDSDDLNDSIYINKFLQSSELFQSSESLFRPGALHAKEAVPSNDSDNSNDAHYKDDKIEMIVADNPNHYASEFFHVGDYVEKYSSRFSLLNRIDAMIAEMDCAQASNQGGVQVSIEGSNQESIQSVLQAVIQVSNEAVEQAGVQSIDTVDTVFEAKLPEPINFWTAPIRYKKETVAAPVVDMQAPPARVPGCSCDECLGVDTTSNSATKPFVFSIRLVAPLGWCALFIVCSISIISQLSSLADQNCVQTQRLCDSGKYQEALNSSSLAIRCNPFSPTAYYERARVLVHMLRYREAEECVNRCLALDPDHACALDARAALSLKLGKPTQTISDTKKLMALTGDRLNALQYGNMAVAYYNSGRFEEAIKYYDRALALDSHSLTLGLGKSYCLSGKQQHRQALAACNRLIQQYGAKSQVLALRGYCLQRLHELAAAQKDFDLALANSPANPTYYGYRAALMSELNKPEAALSDYEKAADLDRSSASTQYVVAKMLKDLGRNKEALAYYDRLAQLPSFAYSFDQHQERAALNYSAGRYEACLADLKRAIELKPDCHLHGRLALCLAHLGQDGEARKAIAQANRQSPDSSNVMLAEAQVYAILGQSLSAVDKYSRVLRTNGASKEALIGRGQCYFGRGQWASAAHDFKRALAMGAADSTVQNNLAQCERVLAHGAAIKLDLPTQKIVDLAKLDRVGLVDKGRKAFQDGDMQVATLYFAELVKREPANMEARNCLAHSLEGAGNHEQAVAIFEPLSQRDLLALNDQFCYAHALAASGLYDRSIAIMQRLHNWEPANMNYRLELTKMFSAAGQIDKAIGMCRDSLAMNGSTEERKSLNNVYESLVTEKLRSKKDVSGTGATDAAATTRAETEG